MQTKANMFGISAIAMWSVLALFTSVTTGIGPFQMLALTFFVSALIGFGFIARKGRAGWALLRQPLRAWVLGVGGLFGYHFFYFTALSHAPVADASLIAYLWPLLIVVFSAFLPGERLRWFHLVGAFMGLGGATLLVAAKGEFSFSSQFAMGYLAAVVCSLIWSLYSVLNRTQGHIPTESVAGFCLLTALFGLMAHFAFESWVSPTGMQWLAILALGAGPVGASFYAWDYGTKRGNIHFLGVCSYGAPLFSTILLTLSGQAEATLDLMLGCLLITFGAVMGSLDMFRRKPKPVPAAE